MIDKCKIHNCANKCSPESHLCGFHAGGVVHFKQWLRRAFPLKQLGKYPFGASPIFSHVKGR